MDSPPAADLARRQTFSPSGWPHFKISSCPEQAAKSQSCKSLFSNRTLVVALVLFAAMLAVGMLLPVIAASDPNTRYYSGVFRFDELANTVLAVRGGNGDPQSLRVLAQLGVPPLYACGLVSLVYGSYVAVSWANMSKHEQVG